VAIGQVFSMASYQTLKDMRDALAFDVVETMCRPCNAQRYSIDTCDPMKGTCHCDEVEPFIERLATLDRALFLSKTYLSEQNTSLHENKTYLRT